MKCFGCAGTRPRSHRVLQRSGAELQEFTKLSVWNKAHALAADVYRVTRVDPGRLHAQLVGQARRAAISVAANIAEGAGRSSGRDFARFLSIAVGSLTELESHILIARSVGFVRRDSANAICAQIHEIRRMLVSLSKRVRSKAEKPLRECE